MEGNRMTGNIQTSAIMSAGMKVLRETLGVVEAEIFITSIKNIGLDYTKWRDTLWEDISLRELMDRAAAAEDKYSVPESVQIM